MLFLCIMLVLVWSNNSNVESCSIKEKLKGAGVLGAIFFKLQNDLFSISCLRHSYYYIICYSKIKG